MELLAILVSLLSCVIALLSAFYARKSQKTAQEANNISVQNNLRPLRLSVYKLMKEYAHYCSTYSTIYSTIQSVKPVEGTRDLVEHIESLRWEIDSYGPLKMPDIEEKAIAFQNKGWQLQRVLDNLAGYGHKPHDDKFEVMENEMHNITDWFAQEKKEIKNLFTRYLADV